MSFEIFWPAAMAAMCSFIVSFALFIILIRRTSERVWAFGVAVFISVSVYVFITGLTFAENSYHYMPDYLWKLFF